MYDFLNDPDLNLLLADFSGLKWGSRGKDGKQPYEVKPLVELGTDHLMNILKNCSHIRGTIYEIAIRTMLEMHRGSKI